RCNRAPAGRAAHAAARDGVGADRGALQACRMRLVTFSERTGLVGQGQGGECGAVLTSRDRIKAVRRTSRTGRNRSGADCCRVGLRSLSRTAERHRVGTRSGGLLVRLDGAVVVQVISATDSGAAGA